LIVPPRDAEALAVALRRMIDEPELAEKLGKTAVQIALNRFTKDVMIDRMEAVFAAALKERT
jgi:glycosyltransferase involved in cell wall biosynthesis